MIERRGERLTRHLDLPGALAGIAGSIGAEWRVHFHVPVFLAELKDFFASNGRYPGWVEVQWSKPTGLALEKVIEELKALKLTVRNVPIGAAAADGACLFTGEPAVERVLVGKAY